MTDFPFTPTGATVPVTATTSTANNTIASWPSVGGVVRVTNASNALAFVAFGTAATVVSTTTGMPILPNSVELFTVGQKQTNVATIAAATATMYFTPGQGGV
jgi:hypothetical protein